MRIAIVLLNEGRGSGEVARQHAAALVRRGHEVAFIHAGNAGLVPGAVNIDVLLDGKPLPTHEYLPAAGTSQRPVSTMSANEAFAYLPHYERALRRAGFVDLYIGHHANLPAIAVHRAAAATGTPYALFVHGTGIEPRLAGGYADEVWDEIELAIRRARGIITTTEYVRDELVRPLTGVPVSQFLVLPVGVDIDAYRPGAGEEARARYELPARYVIAPGALSAAKGPQNVVAATAHYHDLAQTVFIGDGDLRSELEERLGSRGRFLGFVPEADKAALISGATVLTAAPEKQEHFGIIYLEAIASGTVPVAYHGGGVGTIVTADVGRLTDRTPEALGSAIRGVLDDEELTAHLSAAGRRRAERLFECEHLADRLERWLAAVARETTRRPARIHERTDAT